MNAHPDWCNKKHQQGANPRRQNHLRTWRSDRTKALPMTVDLYPCENFSQMFFDVTVSADNPLNRYAGTTRTVITAAEARSLADTLYELAAASERRTSQAG